MNNEKYINGISYFIEAIQGDDTFVRQMIELGLDQGEVIEVRSMLPFNGAVVVQTEFVTLSLRKEDFQCLRLAKKS